MAKGKLPTEDDLLAGLQKVSDGRVLPLKSKGGKSPIEGIFPAGAAGDTLITMATDGQRAYLEPCPAPDARGAAANRKDHGKITDAGRRWVLDKLSPKAALESVRDSLRSLGAPRGVSPGELEVVQAQLANLTDAVQGVAQAIRELLRQRQQADQSVVAAVRAAQAVIERKVADRQVAVPETATPTPDTPGGGAPALASQALRIIREKAAARGEETRFDELYTRLQQIDPSLTPGRFQDLLRELQKAGEVAFSNWGKTLDELPQTDLYFLVGRKGMYYVALARR